MTRHIAFEGIDNFRDFGGYATACGRGLKTGQLYRAGHQARATDADLAKLRELGIAVIVDLRRPNERERDPSRRWPGFEAQVIESDIGQETADEWHTFIMGSDLTPESFRRYMLDYYRAAPKAPRHVDLYSRYFRALADTEGPILVHCAAGKDRTGLICALTHHVAGVHDDDIISDYLLTNDPARIAGRVEFVQQAICEATGRTPAEDAVRVGISVDAEYLARSFEMIRAEFGSIDGYLDRALGLDPAMRERIHGRLLA